MRSGQERGSAAFPNNRRLAFVAVIVAAVIVIAGWATVQRGFEREIERLAEVLELEPGMTVADVGAGGGRYSVALADSVGERGRVFATEVEADKVDEIGERIAGRENMTAVLGELDDAGLPDACCDRILLRNVYHHFSEPVDDMVRSLYRSLKPGGVIAVVDFTTRGSHGASTDAVTEGMTRNGFELVRQVEDWPGGRNDYCLLFRRPD